MCSTVRDHGQPQDTALHPPRAAGDGDQRDQDHGLNRKAHQHQQAKRRGLAQQFCHRVAQRGEHAKTDHQKDAEQGAIFGHAPARYSVSGKSSIANILPCLRHSRDIGDTVCLNDFPKRLGSSRAGWEGLNAVSSWAH